MRHALLPGGVDTHADTHMAAALDPIGGLLGVAEFPASPAGYARLPAWLHLFGHVAGTRACIWVTEKCQRSWPTSNLN
jgi:hypothetical protein